MATRCVRSPAAIAVMPLPSSSTPRSRNSRNRAPTARKGRVTPRVMKVAMARGGEQAEQDGDDADPPDLVAVRVCRALVGLLAFDDFALDLHQRAQRSAQLDIGVGQRRAGGSAVAAVHRREETPAHGCVVEAVGGRRAGEDLPDRRVAEALGGGVLHHLHAAVPVGTVAALPGGDVQRLRGALLREAADLRGNGRSGLLPGPGRLPGALRRGREGERHDERDDEDGADGAEAGCELTADGPPDIGEGGNHGLLATRCGDSPGDRPLRTELKLRAALRRRRAAAPARARRRHDLRHAQAELLVDHDDLAAGDRPPVHQQVDGLARQPVERHDRSGTERQRLADGHARAADLHGELHRDVVQALKFVFHGASYWTATSVNRTSVTCTSVRVSIVSMIYFFSRSRPARPIEAAGGAIGQHVGDDVADHGLLRQRAEALRRLDRMLVLRGQGDALLVDVEHEAHAELREAALGEVHEKLLGQHVHRAGDLRLRHHRRLGDDELVDAAEHEQQHHRDHDLELRGHGWSGSVQGGRGGIEAHEHDLDAPVA